MNVTVTKLPVEPVPPPTEIQIVLDEDSAQRLRAVVGKVGLTGGNGFAQELWDKLGKALGTYGTGRYKIPQGTNIEIIPK